MPQYAAGMQPARNALAVGLVSVLVGCSSKSAEQSPPGNEPTADPTPTADPQTPPGSPQPAAADSPPAVDTSKGSCELTVTGDAEFTGVGRGGPMAVSSLHWYSKEERAKSEGMLPNTPLILNCIPAGASVNFLPSRHSKESDLAFGPGTYDIVKGKSQAGQFTAMMTLGRDPYTIESGRLEITKFDGTGIAGHAKFTATEMGNPKRIEVTAKFDYKCPVKTAICGS
jgi:hypothetical protein